MTENRPADKVQYGSVVATVWKNTQKDKDGNDIDFVSVSLSRSYKDKDGNWQQTSSLRERDLADAELVINEVRKKLRSKETGESPSSPSLNKKQQSAYDAYVLIGMDHDRALASALKVL